MSAPTTFDPSKFLTRVNGSDYLEVKWRLVWLRERHPDAIVETELVSLVDECAIFKARVSLPGGGVATGFGSEAANDFRDYLEKAETKALGRALAALGFGTQFCPDFEFGADQGRIVDAPIDFASTRGRQMANGEHRTARSSTSSGQPATSRQFQFIQAIASELGWADETLATHVTERFSKSVEQLNRGEASAFIELLQGRKGSPGSQMKIAS